MTSKTSFVTQEGPANALALNKDNSQVVIAGRNGNPFFFNKYTMIQQIFIVFLYTFLVFKIFTLLEDKFEEFCNLRVGKNLNLNFSCNDVAWNLIEGNENNLPVVCVLLVIVLIA